MWAQKKNGGDKKTVANVTLKINKIKQANKPGNKQKNPNKETNSQQQQQQQNKKTQEANNRTNKKHQQQQTSNVVLTNNDVTSSHIATPKAQSDQTA